MDSYLRAKRSIAGNVRRVRLRVGKTQEALAEAAGVDVTFIQRVERGTVNISLRSLTSIADALDVRMGDLFRAAEPRIAKLGRPVRPRRKRPN